MSDSRLSGRSSSGGAPGGGRIIAQNQSLLDMLREKTLEHEQQNQEEGVKRFYVESPVFTKEDEENIKFVNTDIEEELQDSLDDEKEPDSVNEMPSLNDLVSKTANLKSRQNTAQFSDSKYTSNNKFDSSRYEDLAARTNYDPSMSQPQPTLKKTTEHDRTWNQLQKGYEKEYGVENSETKSVNFNNNHTEIPVDDYQLDNNSNNIKETKIMTKSDPHIIKPIQNPLKPLSKEQTEELRLLEEEERYQRQLKQRIWETTNDAESVHIPRLDLDDVISDDDDQRKMKKSMLADSLDSSDRTGGHDEDEQFRDSIDYPQANQQQDNSQHELQVKYQELQQRLERLESEKGTAPQLQYPQSQNDQRLQNMFESHRSEEGSGRRMTSSDLKNLQDPRARARYSQEYDYIQEDQYAPTDGNIQSVNQQPNYRGNMPLNFSNEHESYQQESNQYGDQQQYVAEPPYENGTAGHYQNPDAYEEQAYYAENPHHALPPAPNQQIPYEAGHYRPEEQYGNQQNEQSYGQPYPEMEGYRELPQNDESSKDYIDLNKRAIRGDMGSAKSYGKMFHKKKDVQNAPPPPPPVKKKTKPPGKPIASSSAIPSRTSTSNTQAPRSNTRFPPTVEEENEEEALAGDTGALPSGEVSAEDRWAQRANVLSKEKKKKIASAASKSNNNNYKGPLRKYPSASKVEDMKKEEVRNLNRQQSLQNSAVQQRQWPPPQHPQPQQQMRYDYTPSASRQNPAVVNGSHPVSRHAVYTDDGQKLDVDINVKMVSPGPPGSTVPVRRPVNSMQQQRLPTGANPAVSNPYGAESPMQLQSVNSSASTVRHGHPLPPNTGNSSNMQYGYHSPHRGNQQYNYSAPPQYNNEQQQIYYQQDGDSQQTYHIQPGSNRGGTYNGPQPPPQRGGTYPVQDPHFRPSQPNKNSTFTKPRPQHSNQPVKAFDNYQESYDNYNDTYSVQDSYSGMASPISFQQYDNQSSPTPGNMSPYRVIPPITSAEREGRKMPFTQYGPSSNKKSSSTSPRRQDGNTAIYTDPESAGGGGSYMDAFEKNKNKRKDIAYKPYTLHDYRNMKKEVRLGGLGPDTENETIREKRERQQRKLNYAKSINERNREEYEEAKSRPKGNLAFTKDDEDSEQDMIDKRRLALEYAKSVPKPKVRVGTAEDDERSPNSAGLYQPKYKYVPGSHTNSMKTMTTMRAQAGRSGIQNSDRGSKNGQHSAQPRQVSANTERDNEMIDLEALQQRHEQERHKVAMIRQNMPVS